MLRRSTFLHLPVLLVALLACKRFASDDAEKPAASSRPSAVSTRIVLQDGAPKPEWKPGAFLPPPLRVGFDEAGASKRSSQVRVHLPEGARKLRLKVKAPGGERVEVGGKTFRFDGDTAHVEIDLASLLGGLTVSTMHYTPSFGYQGQRSRKKHQQKPPRAETEMTVAVNGAVTTGRFWVESKPAASRLLSDVDGARLVFPGEPAATARDRKSVVFIAPDGYFSSVNAWTGTGAKMVRHKLHDVDLVALARESKGKKIGTCPYVGSKGQKHRVDLYQRVSEVAVYDRRTGKRVGGKTFASKRPKCSEYTRRNVRKKATRVPTVDQLKWVRRTYERDG